MRTASGFTLTEVVLAMAIVAVAVVGVMTAFPVGMEASRDARDENLVPMIVEDVLGRLRAEGAGRISGESTNLRDTFYNRYFYYTADGRGYNTTSAAESTPVTRPNPTDPLRADEGYYVVRVLVYYSPYSDGEAPLQDLENYLYKVWIRIAWPARRFVAMGSNQDYCKYRTFTTYIARNHVL